MAEKILDDIEREYIPHRNLRFLGGWAVMGAAVGILLGGDLFMAFIGGLTAFLIMVMSKILSRNDLPYFFHCAIGGLLATVPAVIFYRFTAALDYTIVPSQVISTGLVVLLAGLTLVQSLLDGITGSPVTASARFFQTMLFTGGIVAGVAMGITVSDLLGVGLPPLETMLGTPSFSSALVRIAGSTVAAAAFAVTCFAERPAIVVSAATGFAGSAIYYVFLLPLGAGRLLATFACAFIVGLLGGLGRGGVEEVKRVVAQRERRPNMVRQHEDGSVERRFVTPPTLPLVVGPRAALITELVAAHHLRTDVMSEVAGEIVVEAAGATRVGPVGPARGGARPRHQFPRFDAITEGTLERLVLPRPDPIL